MTGGQVILHSKAIEGLKRGQNSFRGGCSSRLAWLFCQVLAVFRHGEHRYPPIRGEYLDRLVPIDSERLKRCTSLILYWKRRDTQPITSPSWRKMCCSVGTRP